jgi:hypothetical protein
MGGASEEDIEPYGDREAAKGEAGLNRLIFGSRAAFGP